MAQRNSVPRRMARSKDKARTGASKSWSTRAKDNCRSCLGLADTPNKFGFACRRRRCRLVGSQRLPLQIRWRANRRVLPVFYPTSDIVHCRSAAGAPEIKCRIITIGAIRLRCRVAIKISERITESDNSQRGVYRIKDARLKREVRST